MTPPNCKTCHFNELGYWTQQKKPGAPLIRHEERRCAKRYRDFPDYPNCPAWQREPGTDDE